MNLHTYVKNEIKEIDFFSKFRFIIQPIFKRFIYILSLITIYSLFILFLIIYII